MSLLTTAVAVFSIIAAILATIGKLLVGLLLVLPFRIATYTVALVGSALAFVYAILSQPRLAVILGIGLIVMLLLGPIGVYDTTTFFVAIDAVFESIVAFVYEIFSKLIVVSGIAIYRTLSSWFNTIVSYFFVRTGVLIADSFDLYTMIASSGDYFMLFGAPKLAWTWYSSFFFYFWSTEPLKSRAEVFVEFRGGTPDDDGFVYPYYTPLQHYDGTIVTSGTYTNFSKLVEEPQFQQRAAFEFNTMYGAFGAPSGRPPSILYYIRNIIVDFVVFLQSLGDLVFSALEDFEDPGAKFFPHFILDVNSPLSYWGRLLDILARYFSFAFGTSLHPTYGTQGQQPTRYYMENYIYRVGRFLACIFRYVTLLLFDATTVNRPTLADGNNPDGFALIVSKLKGVPIIDLFLINGTFGTDASLNILTSYRGSCLASDLIAIYSADIYSDGYSQGFTADFVFQSAFTCKGTALKTLTNNVPRCNEWNGLQPPEVDDRIDYVKELWKCGTQLVILFASPNPEDQFNVTSYYTTLLDDANDIYDRVVQPLVQIAVSITYYFNALNFDSDPLVVNGDYDAMDCCSDCAFWAIGKQTDLSFRSVVSYAVGEINCFNAYDPGTLGGGVEADYVSCAIAYLSQNAGQPFTAVCDVVEAISDAVQYIEDFFSLSGDVHPFDGLKCEPARRKRSLASEQFGKNRKTLDQFGWKDKMRLYLMRYSSDARSAYRAALPCFTDAAIQLRNCSSSCAYFECTKATLGCAVEHIPRDNIVYSLLAANSSSSLIFYNSILAGAYIYDAVRGCEDSGLWQHHKTVSATTELLRDWAARFLLMWTEYLPAYFTCMNAALQYSENQNTTMAEISMFYLQCLGVDTGAAAAAEPEGTTSDSLVVTGNGTMWSWQRQMEALGVKVNDSMCAQLLYSKQLVLENTGSMEALSAEHMYYRFCMFSFAIGVRATAQHTSRHKLGEYLNMWRAPLAIMQSTYAADTVMLANTVYAPLLPNRAAGFPLLANGFAAQNDTNESENGQRKGLAQRLQEFLTTNYEWMNVAVTLFHYLADSHEQVVSTPSTGYEKDILAQHLFEQHFGVQLREPAPQHVESRMAKTMQERKQRFSHATREKMRGLTSIDVINRFRDTLYWAGTLPVDTHVGSYENFTTYDCPYEFGMQINEFGQKTGLLPQLSVRALRRPEDALHYPNTGSQSLATWRQINLNRIEEVLQQRMRTATGINRGTERQLVVRAASALHALRTVLHRDIPSPRVTAEEASSTEMVMRADAFIRALWSIVNRRVRVQGLPPYHAAAMIIHVMSGRDLTRVPDYLNHKMSYLAGTGFVDNEVYDRFMQDEQYQRERALGTYTASATGQEADNFAWITVDYAKTYRLNLEIKRRNALPARARQIRRKMHFSHRSAWLKRHNLHSQDEYLHLIAPQHWRYRAEAANATTPQQREFYTLQASLSSGDFLGAIDSVIELLGLGPPNLLTSIEETFVDFMSDVWSSVSDGSFETNLENTLLSILDAIKCDVAQDVRAGGTGDYKLGCIPYLPERLFDWYEVFPEDPMGKGVLGLFEGPGYIEWPSSVILDDCPSPKVPSLQDPNPDWPFWLRIQSTVTLSGATSETEAQDQQAPVYPTVLSGTFLDFLDSVIIVTNWCAVDTTNRPLCSFSDWCERSYISAADMGFTDGFVNLQVWINDVRYLYNVAVAVPGTYLKVRALWIPLLFVILALSDYIFTGSGSAYTIVEIVLIYDVFFNQQLTRIAAPVLALWGLLYLVPLVAWIVAIALSVRLWAYSFSGVVLFQSVVDLGLTVFPDTLLVTVLNFITANNFLSSVVSTQVFSDSTVRITSGMAMFTATEANNIYAIFSIYNVFLLVVTAIPIVFAGVLLVGIASVVLAWLLSALFLLVDLYFVISSILLRGSVRRLKSRAEDLEDTSDENDFRLQRQAENRQLTVSNKDNQQLRRRLVGLESK